MTDVADTAEGGDLEPVGTVTELWRFPVKSLQGEPLTDATLSATGIEGDRAWGLVDPATGQVLSAKTLPQLLDASATTTADGTRIDLPDGTTLTAGDPDVDDVLSNWLDRPVTLRPARPDLQTSYEMTFDPPDDSAERFEIPSPTGTFFDLAGLHLLTTGSLATAAAEHPGGVWSPRRFRPNVVVATPDADSGDAYPEDAWVDRQLEIGSARVKVLMRTVRCAIPLRAQPDTADQSTVPRDVGIFRTLTRLHDNHLGVYADITRPGPISLGAPISLP